jgi:hypothetical protein
MRREVARRQVITGDGWLVSMCMWLCAGAAGRGYVCSAAGEKEGGISGGEGGHRRRRRSVWGVLDARGHTILFVLFEVRADG